MPQINLLKQNTSRGDIGQTAESIGVKVLSGVLVLLIVWYAWIFIDLRRTNNAIVAKQALIQEATQSIASMKGKDELVTRQAQLKEVSGLIANHPYWSSLLPQIAKSTLKNATYSNLKALSDGTLTLTVQVGSLVELDKFLQVFDQPEFNKNFSDLRIGAISNVQVKDKVLYQFDVKFKYNTQILQYKFKKLNS